MGLYEDMLARVFPDAVKFPELQQQGERDAWDLPRRSDLPQNLLPPHLRNRVGAVDASAPAVQSALGNAPGGPDIPAALRVHAGMLPPLNETRSPFMTEPEAAMQRLVNPDARAEPVPLPRDRPPEAVTDDGGLPAPNSMGGGLPTDMGSRSRNPQPLPIAPQAAAAPVAPDVGMLPSAEPSILDRIRTGLGNNSNTLLAIGAGLAGAPNWGQGISRAASAAIPARAADIQQSLAATGRGVGTQALIKAGVPTQLAIAAQYDPDLRKKLIDSYIVDRKSEIKTVKSKDMFGNETERLVAVNPYDLTQKEITGGAGEPVGGTNKTFAPGVSQTNFDPTKNGDEYLAQFSPEVQSGVKSYLRGDSLMGAKGSQPAIKMAAQKYAEDMGIPANDQDYVARKNFKSSLGDTKSGVGLQVKGFQQGAAHLADAADRMIKLGNVNLGVTGVGAAANYLKNQTAKQGGIAAGLDAAGQALAGEVGKLYSGATGGGVHEREATKKLFANPNATAEQQAGALEATLHLMEGGLNTLEGRKRQLFGNQEIPGGNFVDAETAANIEKVKKAIKVLRGEETPAPAAVTPKAAAAPKPGKYQFDPATGALVPLP